MVMLNRNIFLSLQSVRNCTRERILIESPAVCNLCPITRYNVFVPCANVHSLAAAAILAAKENSCSANPANIAGELFAAVVLVASASNQVAALRVFELYVISIVHAVMLLWCCCVVSTRPEIKPPATRTQAQKRKKPKM